MVMSRTLKPEYPRFLHAGIGLIKTSVTMMLTYTEEVKA
jgi:hypothetical protein